MAKARTSYYLSPEQIANMSRAELARFVNQAASTANKRIKRLQEKGLTDQSSIYQELRNARINARFSTAMKDELGLVQELIFINRFLEAEDSTITGARQVKRKAKSKVGQMTEAQEKRFWNLVSQYKKVHPGLYASYGSERVINTARSSIKDNPRTRNIDKLLENLDDRLYAETEKMMYSGDEDSEYWLP